MSIRYTVVIDEGMFSKLAALAIAEGRSKSNITRHAIQLYIHSSKSNAELTGFKPVFLDLEDKHEDIRLRDE